MDITKLIKVILVFSCTYNGLYGMTGKVMPSLNFSAVAFAFAMAIM